LTIAPLFYFFVAIYCNIQKYLTMSIGGQRWRCDGEGGGSAYACIRDNGFVSRFCNKEEREGGERARVE
jgi:hypothetical protein